jgi:cell division protein FtsZ
VVTLPFSFEGARKMRIAEQGLTQMQLTMDALITVKNDNIMRLPENRHMSLVTAFKAVDMVLREAISCIAELILTTGVINVDFADVTTVFRQSSSSDAMLGLGRSHNGALEALQRAISSPLLDKNVENARGFILNLTGDAELSLYDVDAATRYIYEHTSPQVNIILGTVIDENMKGDVQAMVIATDFIDSPRPVGQMQQPQAQRPQPGQAAAMGQAFSQPRPFGQPQPVGQQSAASARPADAKQSATQQAQAQPQQADDFQIPAFMQRRQPAQPQRPQGAFAMPAFKLAPDEPHKDK